MAYSIKTVNRHAFQRLIWLSVHKTKATEFTNAFQIWLYRFPLEKSIDNEWTNERKKKKKKNSNRTADLNNMRFNMNIHKVYNDLISHELWSTSCKVNKTFSETKKKNTRLHLFHCNQSPYAWISFAKLMNHIATAFSYLIKCKWIKLATNSRSLFSFFFCFFFFRLV